MNKLKSMFKRVVNREGLDVYRLANPSPEDFSHAIQDIESESTEKKTLIAESLVRKLNRPQSNQQSLNLLLLCDYLSGTCSYMLAEFPQQMQAHLSQKQSLKPTSKQDKILLSQTTFINFYLQYLKEKAWKNETIQTMNIGNLKQSLKYSQSAISCIKLIFNYDFVIEYALAHSEIRMQIKMAVENMLRRSSEDMNFFIKFVDKWSYIIVEGRPESVMVNDVYEQVIYISKQVSKLEYLAHKIQIKISMSKYEINKNLNSKIEKSMIDKEDERRQYYSQKRFKTESDMNEEAEITESEINMKIKI